MMRKFLPFLLFIICLGNIQANNNPVADPAAIVTSGDMRFTVLTPEMIRIEWSSEQKFEDRASFTVVNRRLPVPLFTTEEKDGFLYIKTDKLTLQYRIGAFPGTFNPASSQNLKITFEMDGRTVSWYPWKKDNLNLKGTTRTLDGSNGDNKRAELEDGIISRSGWAVIDETALRGDGSISLMFDGSEGVDWVDQRTDVTAMDWYFMGYGHDYKKALSDYTKIAGKIPMPPMYAFGYWYSKYQDYTQQELKDLVLEMEEEGVPLDVLVIDMGWHTKPHWTGWTWDKNLIPNPEELISWLHFKNLKTTLNLHPADGIRTEEANHEQLAKDLGLPTNETVAWDIETKSFYEAFFRNILRPHENIGVDFWWLDWQQRPLAYNVDKLSNTFWLNHVFYTDMQIQDKARPMIFHRWGGLGNHRYQIGFSGDSHATFPTLAFQPYFTATASNVGYGYWSHDIGGHYQDGDNDPELFLRWIQYGVFSPIVRTHSTNADHIERRIWKYPNFPLMKEALELRYAMVPYIYTQARVAYDTGISICRPLYYDLPDNNEAYKHEDQYMFGEDILAAPVVTRSDSRKLTAKQIWLPEGKWYEVTSGKMIDGNQTITRTYTHADIPHFYKAGAIIPNYPKLTHLKNRPDKLILKFAPGTGELKYYEDENDNDNYQNGAYSFTRVTQEVSDNNGTYTIYPAEGNFNGMLTERSYNIELLAVTQPEEVKVNGVTYSMNSNKADETWEYDAEKSIAKIYIPNVSCSAQTEINVKFSENTSSAGNVQNTYTFEYLDTNRTVNIKFNNTPENISVFLYESTGKLVLNNSFQSKQSISISLPRQLSKGVYLVNLNYDGVSDSKKLIINS